MKYWLQFAFIFQLVVMSVSVAEEPSVTASSRESQVEALETYGYRVNASQEELNEVRSKIRSAGSISNGQDCGFRGALSSGRTVGHYDSVIQEMTSYILQNYSQDCVQQLVSQYKATKYEFGNYLVDSVPCRYPDVNGTLLHRAARCPLIMQYRSTFQATQQRLTDALIAPTEENRVCAEDNLDPDLSVTQLSDQILNVLGEHEQIDECSDLSVGQTDVRNRGQHLEYALKRESPQRLQATLVIDLKRTSHSVMPKAQMFSRIKSCIETASQYFKSPEGEQLNVTIISPEEAASMPAEQRPASQTINYGTNFTRGNSANYRENFDCSTITHELMHSMGLLDEYHEGGDGYFINKETGDTVDEASPEFPALRDSGVLEMVSVNNQCRSIAIVNPSILSNHKSAVSRLLGSRNQCTCNTDNCRDIISSGNQNRINLLGFKPISVISSLCRYNGEESAELSRDLTASQLQSLPELPLVSIDVVNSNHLKITTRSLRHDTYDPLTLAAKLQVGVYNCRCSEASCRDKLNRLRSMTADTIRSPECPRGFEQNNSDHLLQFGQGPVNTTNTTVVSNNTIQTNKMPTASLPHNSLLQPSHFTKLKYGSCQTRAEKYRECQRYAYVSECENRPAYCEDESQWLLQEQ